MIDPLASMMDIEVLDLVESEGHKSLAVKSMCQRFEAFVQADIIADQEAMESKMEALARENRELRDALTIQNQTDVSVAKVDTETSRMARAFSVDELQVLLGHLLKSRY